MEWRINVNRSKLSWLKNWPQAQTWLSSVFNAFNFNASFWGTNNLKPHQHDSSQGEQSLEIHPQKNGFLANIHVGMHQI
jgi:hypothetical protein